MNKLGRPTKYTPDMPMRVLELKKKGAAFIDIAYELDVAESSLYNMAKENPELRYALDTQANYRVAYNRHPDVTKAVINKRDVRGKKD